MRIKKTCDNVQLKKIIIILLILIVVNIKMVLAIPVPHGIDGRIYELDSITEAVRGIDFYVHNLNNGHMISGKTGYGSSGRYSVSLNGNDGNIVVIKAWNKYNQVNTTLTLTGVMRNVNLLLNMTYPPSAPNITSVPVISALEDQLYFYKVETFDENNEDLLEHLLIIKPLGMSINTSTGIIEWIPLQKNIGRNEVKVQVSDGLFLTNQSFNLTVENVNDRPQIISLPITNATEDADYFYDIDAVDEDNDFLTYTLIKKINGMIINELTGMISWTPDNSDVGTHDIAVQASDGNLTDRQEFRINVANTNDLPVVTSLPFTRAVQDELYIYDVDAIDVDNDILNYSLVNYPNGMEINNINGIITFLPSNDDIGIHNITVKVSDDAGSVLQPFALIVENVNDAPVINSTPIKEVKTGKKYIYDADAYDIDNDILGYYLLESPQGMKIDEYTGLISWNPKGHQKANNSVILSVSDGNLTDEQNFTVFVYSSEKKEEDIKVGNGGGFGKGKGQSIQSPKEAGIIIKDIKKENDASLTTITLTSNGFELKADIEVISKRPEKVKKISRRVYKYLKIDSLEEDIGEAEINFYVAIDWLEENEIRQGEIVLSRYADDGWQDLVTENIDKDNKFAYYIAKTPGFSYFAITVKEGVATKNIFKPVISGVKQPFRISGTIYNYDKTQVVNGTPFIIENINSSERVRGKTGIGPYPGAYYVLMHGKMGDLIKIEIGNIDDNFYTVLNDADNLDFIVNKKRNGFKLITGSAISQINLKGSYAALFILIIFLISVILLKMNNSKMNE